MIKTLYEPFRHWSDGGAVWIISDTHFDDPDCLLMNPNWLSPADHIDSINRVIGATNPCLIHLGDIGDASYMKYIKARHKVLILGNHDMGASKYRAYFDEIYTGPLMIAEKIILSHEPLDIDWAFNIHGHVHNGAPRPDVYHINCAADVQDYQPINLGDLIKDGCCSEVSSIHRQTIDAATERRMIFG